LDNIHDRIAEDKPGAAANWLRRANEQFSRLAKNPLIGQARDEIRPGMRSISHGNYVIYFRLREEGQYVEIARVLHGARDTQSLL
jgi:toxin ParE1/3/4